jgi:hypothetical protein
LILADGLSGDRGDWAGVSLSLGGLRLRRYLFAGLGCSFADVGDGFRRLFVALLPGGLSCSLAD